MYTYIYMVENIEKSAYAMNDMTRILKGIN